MPFMLRQSVGHKQVQKVQVDTKGVADLGDGNDVCPSQFNFFHTVLVKVISNNIFAFYRPPPPPPEFGLGNPGFAIKGCKWVQRLGLLPPFFSVLKDDSDTHSLVTLPNPHQYYSKGKGKIRGRQNSAG